MKRVLERGDYEEKRDHRRMGVDTPMRFSQIETGEVQEAVLRDLSATGMLIECRVPVPVGAILEVAVTPERALVPPLEAVVEVLRVDSRRNDLFHLGVAIREIKGSVP